MAEQKDLGQKESGEKDPGEKDQEQKESVRKEFSQQDFCVDGYRFGSVDDAKEAQVEKIKAAYFINRLQGKNMESMLAVYDKILDERIFETPIGWEYLKRMQRELRRSGLEEERIRPIPMYVTFSHKEDVAAPVRERIRPSRKKSEDKKKLQISVMVNILLVILVLAMFYITLNSKNPNIINYKNAILNEYASWEQELTDRENEIREKEKTLGIE